MMKKFLAALVAVFFATAAYAQNAGTVTNHAFPIGKGPNVQGYTSLLCGSAQLAVGQAAADPICRTLSGDATLSAAGVVTLATVNGNVGTFGSATLCITTTQNAKGLTTAISAATCTPAIGSITGLGTGVATALGVNVGTAGAFVVNGGALGSPSSVGTMPAFIENSAITGSGSINWANNANSNYVATTFGNSDPGASAFVTHNLVVTNAGSLAVQGGSTASAGLALFRWTGAGGLFIDQNNAAGNLTFRTGATPTAAITATPAQAVGVRDTSPQGVFSANDNVTSGVVGALPVGANSVARLVGKDTQVVAQEINAFGNEALVVGTRADGTAASKATIAAANEPIYANFAYGWNGSSYVAASGFIMWSSEAYTGTKTGSYMSFYSTPTATTGIVENMRLQPSGGLAIGTVANDPGLGGITVSGSYRIGTKLTWSATAPTVNAGFCTTPSISANNGTAAFTITIGSACAAATGVLNMPAASVGWACNFRNVTNPNTSKPDMTASTTNTVSVTNYVRTTGVAGNWTASDVIVADCTAY